MSEGRFCSEHSLNRSVLRMTSDAKMQLKNLLCDVGFPQECLHPMPFRYRGDDENLDLVRFWFSSNNLCNPPVRYHCNLVYLTVCFADIKAHELPFTIHL